MAETRIIPSKRLMQFLRRRLKLGEEKRSKEKWVMVDFNPNPAEKKIYRELEHVYMVMVIMEYGEVKGVDVVYDYDPDLKLMDLEYER